MNIHDPKVTTPKVTTGALPASRKVYVAPEAAPDLKVPLREIMLDPSSGEPPLPVYDTTGPYSDPGFKVDVEKGLPRTRLAWVKERGGVEDYDGRVIQPVDNGNVTGKHLARDFPTAHRPLRATASFPSPRSGEGGAAPAAPGGASAQSKGDPTPALRADPPLSGEGLHPLTQLEWARAGVVTKEMIYIAARENLGRKQQLERAEAALADGESFGASVPAFI
ncbi:MAG: phosphomethylpyrimidine synthase, partial [Pseudolabrys sp.]